MTQNPDTNNKQLCVITIMFPIVTDDEAINYKKRIGEITADIPEARIDFRLTSGRPNSTPPPPDNAQG